MPGGAVVASGGGGGDTDGWTTVASRGVTQKLCLASTPSDVRHRKNDAARFKRADEALMHGTFGFF